MIILKSASEIERMKVSGQIAGKILHNLGRLVSPGIETIELEKLAISQMRKEGCESSFHGYNGYPSYICVSVNEVVVHGMAGKYTLKEGDIVSIDVGVLKDGYHGDTAATFSVGNINSENKRLIKITEEALTEAINEAVSGRRLSDISHRVQTYVEANGFSVVRDFVGHGIGQDMHEEPQIPNFGPPNRGPVLKPGMVLAIEPMVNAGGYKVEVDDDGWTVRTKDKKHSAHFEHTVAITNAKAQILTLYKDQ